MARTKKHGVSRSRYVTPDGKPVKFDVPGKGESKSKALKKPRTVKLEGVVSHADDLVNRSTEPPAAAASFSLQPDNEDDEKPKGGFVKPKKHKNTKKEEGEEDAAPSVKSEKKPKKPRSDIGKIVTIRTKMISKSKGGDRYYVAKTGRRRMASVICANLTDEDPEFTFAPATCFQAPMFIEGVISTVLQNANEWINTNNKTMMKSYSIHLAFEQFCKTRGGVWNEVFSEFKAFEAKMEHMNDHDETVQDNFNDTDEGRRRKDRLQVMQLKGQITRRAKTIQKLQEKSVLNPDEQKQLAKEIHYHGLVKKNLAELIGPGM